MRRASLVLSAVVLAALVGCKSKEQPAGGQAAKTEVITLRYANFPVASTFPCVQMERWKEQVETRTEGRVKINTFPDSTLLDAKGMMDGVIAGQADIGCLCMAYQPGLFKVTNATSLPLNIPDAKTGALVLLDLWRKYDPEPFKKVKVLTMFTTAPSNVMSRKAVRTLEDIKGLDIRASGGAAEILKAWGANAVGMPMSDTPEALQKGTVQGVFSSAEVMKDYKFAESCKFVTMTDTAVYPFAVVMNLDSWNALPQDVKDVFDGLIEEQALWTGQYMDDHVEEALAWSKENQGVEVIALSDEQKQQWNNPLAPTTEKWIADMSGQGLPAQQIVDDLRAMIDKHMKAPAGAIAD